MFTDHGSTIGQCPIAYLLPQQNLAAAIEKKRDHERQLAAERSAEAKARREQRLAEVKKKEEEAAAAAALERQMGPAQVPTQATYMEEVRTVCLRACVRVRVCMFGSLERACLTRRRAVLRAR